MTRGDPETRQHTGTAAAGGAGRISILGSALLVLAAADFAAAEVGEPPLPRPAPRAERMQNAQVAQSDVPVPRPHPNRRSSSTDVIGSLIGGAGVLMSLAEEPQNVAALPIVSALTSGELGLRSAVQRLEAGDVEGATRIASASADPADKLLMEWLIAVSGQREVSAARIARAAAQLDGWPGQALIQLRYEQALVRSSPDPAAVVEAFAARRPSSEAALLMLAKAYLAVGRRNDAVALIRPYWRGNSLSAGAEKEILANFQAVLTAADHRERAARLLYDNDNDEALRTARLVGGDFLKLAEAWALVNRRDRKAESALNGVPASMRADPGYQYARVLWLRRANRIADAARILVGAPQDPAVLFDTDAWSSERRSIARSLVDSGDPALAYRVLDGHAAATRLEQVEIEFQAGWVALRYLRDAAGAAKHFNALAAASTAPLSQSRAAYWLGRSADLAGQHAEAEAHYRRAASYTTTFYGQLALSRLQQTHLSLSVPPPPTEAMKAEFGANPLVRAMDRLIALGRDDQAELFARHLADTMTNPAHVALLAARAEGLGKHQLALQVGKLAQVRGLPVDALAFPTGGIPASVPTSYVDRPVVFAIARQESAFNHAAVSRAGARGLLQLMPATARQTAREIGVAYSESRLTRDPEYNATLGAAHLSALFQKFAGSYVMSFAAYNAGSSRVEQWVAAYGDPRDPKVDVIDWIERIPFSETRNYVQRTMENLQVYKALFGDPALSIEADLRRGRRG